MKYILLCAGSGKRMMPYTKDVPKCMLEFSSKPIISYHIEIARNAGIEDIVVVKGYKGEKINFPNIKYYVNDKFSETNMVESFMLACKEFNDDVVLSYGDIIYNSSILDTLLSCTGDFLVAVDIDWKPYWLFRYGNLTSDTESLVIKNELITELGETGVTQDKIDARYIGLLKFSKRGLKIISEIYNSDRKRWKTAHMTDLLQEIINRGFSVKACKVKDFWIEFDTKEDFDKSREWMKNK